MRPSPRRSRLATPVAIGLIVAGCGGSVGARSGATEQSGSMRDLWRGGLAIAIVVGAIVLSLITWCVLRYRHRADDGEPTQRQYHVPIEIAYTVIPIVIVLVLFVVSYSVQNRVDALSADPAVVVEVRGFQWQWQFHYRAEDITVTGSSERTPELVVPVGEPIRFVLTSRDVIHSFYVPEFLFKRDVIPGVNNRFDVTVEHAGRYRGYCAEFCGLDHASMTFSVRALSPAAFDRWVAKQQAA